MTESMTRLEKAALTSAVSGAVFNVFLYGIGATLATAATGPLFIARLIAAIVQAAAFDLVAIATVMGMRQGRRGRWSLITAWASALVSAAIALAVAGVAALPWLHAANALIVLAFTLHLLTPRLVAPDERHLRRVRQTRATVRRLCATVRQERTALRQTRATADHLAERLTIALAQPRQIEPTERILLNGKNVSLRQLSGAVGTPLTTLRHRLAQLDAPEEV